VDLPLISLNLQKAVLAAEDSAFFEHDGIYWESIEKAWDKNQRSLARAQRQNSRAAKMPKIVGGSTITQQLAKNLFLSGERSYVRKAQEFLITLYIEALLDKHRILEIYLNHVEWGSGVFGAQAAAQRYFAMPPKGLGRQEAARLSVMLPRPRHHERMPQSAYLNRQTEVISNRIDQVGIPPRAPR
jgi:monofunctional biosynthetic peptidoglycan transglycosylase